VRSDIQEHQAGVQPEERRLEDACQCENVESACETQAPFQKGWASRCGGLILLRFATHKWCVLNGSRKIQLARGAHDEQLRRRGLAQYLSNPRTQILESRSGLHIRELM